MQIPPATASRPPVSSHARGPLRIAVWHNLYSGGGLRALQTHVAGLLERGHHVTAWCVGRRDPDWQPFGPEVEQRVVELRRPDGLLARARPNWLRDLEAMDDACARCAREMEAGDFDLVFANTCQQYSVPFVARFVTRLPCVIYLQEPRRDLYEAAPALAWVGAVDEPARGAARVRRELMELRRWYALRAQARREWRSVHAADAVLVNSYFSRESVMRAYARDAAVCYLGIDTELFRPTDAPRERFVVGLGAMDRTKRVDLAVRAMARLAPPRPPLVWIADRGDADYGAAVEALARESGVELVVRRGIRDAALVDTLSRAALMLYTSRLEPFGLAPLEANACDTPVVAVAEGGVRESVVDGVNGMLVDPDPDALACGMRTLLDDPERAATMGARAAEHVRERWAAGASVDRLEQHIFRTLDRASGSARSVTGARSS
jgi:glycosyltransferase involved in cell wall biosynthesis